MNIEDYRAVKINDCEDCNVNYGIIMLNNKHTIKEFQAVINNIKNKYFNCFLISLILCFLSFSFILFTPPHNHNNH